MPAAGSFVVSKPSVTAGTTSNVFWRLTRPEYEPAHRERVRAPQPGQVITDAPGRRVPRLGISCRRRAGDERVVADHRHADAVEVLVGEHVAGDVAEEVVRRPLPAAARLVDHAAAQRGAQSHGPGGAVGLLERFVREPGERGLDVVQQVRLVAEPLPVVRARQPMLRRQVDVHSARGRVLVAGSIPPDRRTAACCEPS